MVSNPPSEPLDHYFAADPTTPSAPGTLDMVLPEGRIVTLATDRGVFSSDHLDAGTRFLLSAGPDPAGLGAGDAPVLVDVGSGYGPITVALALRVPAATVWAVEPNARARELCRLNADTAGVGDRVRVVSPEEVPDDLTVDQIWSNPPIRIGKDALHELLQGWLARLDAPNGRALLVVNRNLGADSLARWLVETGWATERLASRAGYRILAVSAAKVAP